MLLMIDNYDSFTHNLVQYFAELGEIPKVVRNDKITVDELLKCDIDRLVVSPGPCTPKEAGISCEAIRACAKKNIPVFGVCLGMQSFAAEFGASIIHAPYLMHGKLSSIEHDGRGIFMGLPSPFNAVRYHSLSVDETTIPDEIEISARTSDGIIMGLRHKKFPISAVQFHPESILSEHGHKLLDNFIKMYR